MASSVLVYGDLKAQKLRIDNLPALTHWIAAQSDGASFRAVFELTDTSRRGRLVTFYRWILLPQFAEHAGNEVKAQHHDLWLALTENISLAGIWNELSFTAKQLCISNVDIAKDLATLGDETLSKYVQDAVRVAAECGCPILDKP